MTIDAEFYLRQIAEEQAAAAAATDPRVQARHDQLAHLYTERLAAMWKRQARPLKLVIDNGLE